MDFNKFGHHNELGGDLDEDEYVNRPPNEANENAVLNQVAQILQKEINKYRVTGRRPAKLVTVLEIIHNEMSKGVMPPIIDDKNYGMHFEKPPQAQTIFPHIRKQ
jgi:hypothetical protein